MNIRQEVQQELSRGNVDKEISNLVLAAFDGVEAIDRALAGEVVETSEAVPDDGGQISSVYLQDITVSGFRGIGPETKLKIPLGPGLTVVVGRNGSGKSSFSEALEVLLTGDSYRWKKKPKVWGRGWENLHHDDNPKITAHFQVEGMNGQTVVQRIWNNSSKKLEDSKFFVQHDGQSHSNLDEIGWEEPLDTYRPILSYNELSMIEDRPSDLYDILSKVLGLEELSVVTKNLADARRDRSQNKNRVTNKLEKDIVRKLDELEDERARRVSEALKPPWDLETIKKIIDSRKLDSSYKDLRNLINIPVPDKEEVTKVAHNLQDACKSLANLSGTEAEQAGQMVLLLKKALEHYETHYNQACPVCRVGVLDDVWHADVLERIKDLEKTAQGYQQANDNMDLALKEARQIVSVPNLLVTDMVDTDKLISTWKDWNLLPDNKDKVSEHILSLYSVVRDQAGKISEQASKIFSDRQDKWDGFLPELLTWVSEACKVITEEGEIVKIERAAEEVKGIMSNLRSARWSPIAEEALNLWKDLRLQSNINLHSVKLDGSGTRRKVDLKVDVDGVDADALSVASQGELSCLALSLFFPRVMLSATPFHFIVIDDPVQAMDPARVDGLAKVFAKIAEERQLIVFTHDNRLPESLRLLKIDYLCLEVVRDLKSNVSVDKIHDPVIRYFYDARSVINDRKQLRWAIPGLCRSGLEAACVEAVWQKGLKAEKSREEIEEELSEAKILCQRASLVLFDEGNQGHKVFDKIQEEWGIELAEAYRHTNNGAHNKCSDYSVLSALIDNCLELAKKLRCHNV